MNKQQPDALRLAAMLTADEWPGSVTLVSYARECVAELLRQHARITALESQLAQRFDAADMATAAAQGFRDGVASLSANAGEPFGWVKQSEIDSSKQLGGSINLWRKRYDCDVPIYLAAPPTAQAEGGRPAELACRMKWLAAEMDTVGSAMLTQAKSTGDAELRSAGWILQDAAEALRASIKDKT